MSTVTKLKEDKRLCELVVEKSKTDYEYSKRRFRKAEKEFVLAKKMKSHDYLLWKKAREDLRLARTRIPRKLYTIKKWTLEHFGEAFDNLLNLEEQKEESE